MSEVRRAGWGVLVLVSVAAMPVLLVALSFAPIWPCAWCVDLDISVFGRCEDCGGRNDRAERKRISFWKRWKMIQELRSIGNKTTPLIPERW